MKLPENLLKKINELAGHLASHPEMGVKEDEMKGLKRCYRSLVADRHYKIVYRIEPGIVYISTLFDCRREP